MLSFNAREATRVVAHPATTVGAPIVQGDALTGVIGPARVGLPET